MKQKSRNPALVYSAPPWEAVQAPRGASLTSVPTKKCVLTLCSVRFSFPDPGFPAWKYPPVTLASLSGTPPSVAFDTDKPQTSWVTVNSYHCPTSWEDINREMELETWMQKIYHNSEPRDKNLKLCHHYQKKIGRKQNTHTTCGIVWNRLTSDLLRKSRAKVGPNIFKK